MSLESCRQAADNMYSPTVDEASD